MTITTTNDRVIYEQEGDSAGANLSGLTLSGAYLEGLTLLQTDFSNTVMNSVNLMDSDLRGAKFIGTTMQGANLMWANLEGADLRDADLYWAMAHKASFKNADVSRAKFNGAALQDADFSDANLEYADFGRDNLGGSTELKGANFTGASLCRARFTGAEYDARTIFPKGFNPEKHEMIYREEKTDRRKTRIEGKHARMQPKNDVQAKGPLLSVYCGNDPQNADYTSKLSEKQHPDSVVAFREILGPNAANEKAAQLDLRRRFR